MVTLRGLRSLSAFAASRFSTSARRWLSACSGARSLGPSPRVTPSPRCVTMPSVVNGGSVDGVERDRLLAIESVGAEVEELLSAGWRIDALDDADCRSPTVGVIARMVQPGKRSRPCQFFPRMSLRSSSASVASGERGRVCPACFLRARATTASVKPGCAESSRIICESRTVFGGMGDSGGV